MNQVVSSNSVYRLCYREVNSDLGKDTIAKRNQGLKDMIHDYYAEVVIIIGTRSDHSDVLINSKNPDSEVTLNSNGGLIIKTASKCLRKDILDFCTRLLPLG